MLYHPADLTGPETKPTDPSSPSHQDSEETDDTHIQTTKLVISHVDVRVTPEELSTLFSTKGRISSLALMEDKYSAEPSQYALVEMSDRAAAESIVKEFHGLTLYDSTLSVHFASSKWKKSWTRDSDYWNVFVGDLAPEVDDAKLWAEFSVYSSLLEARVMWDLVTLKSKGYGFVAFGSKKEAEQAMEDMTGHQIGSRSIRLNWATQKNHRRILPYQFPPALQHLSSECSSQSLPSSSASLLHVSASALSLSDSPKREYAQSRPDSPAKYEDILGQSSPYNTTVYIGNLALDTQQYQLLPLLQSYGYILEINLQASKGFAIVKMDTHESGAMVIASLQSFLLNGRPLRVSWGKERYRRPSTANASMSPASRMLMLTQGGLSSPSHSHLSPVVIAGHSGLSTSAHYSPLSPQEGSGSPPNVNYTAYQGYMVPAYGGYYGYATGPPQHSGYRSPSHHHPQHMGGMTSHMGHSFAAAGYGPSAGSHQFSYDVSPSRSGKGSSETTTAASNSPPAPSSPSTLAK